MKKMRRDDRALAADEAWDLLEGAEYGVLSTVSNDGIPYGVPLNFYLINKSIFFHCAPDGQKLII